MTNNEIIKELKQCEECHYYGECEKSVRKALDIINRQKAEIERLEKQNKILHKRYLSKSTAYNELLDELQETKAEAIKEFAERLKEEGCFYSSMEAFESIDSLVKEMTEGHCDNT